MSLPDIQSIFEQIFILIGSVVFKPEHRQKDRQTNRHQVIFIIVRMNHRNYVKFYILYFDFLHAEPYSGSICIVCRTSVDATFDLLQYQQCYSHPSRNMLAGSAPERWSSTSDKIFLQMAVDFCLNCSAALISNTSVWQFDNTVFTTLRILFRLHNMYVKFL